MKVKITHYYSDDQGETWEKQVFTYDNVYKIESEYQPNNGNSNWLIIHQNNGVLKTKEYISFEQDIKSFEYDEMEVI